MNFEWIRIGIIVLSLFFSHSGACVWAHFKGSLMVVLSKWENKHQHHILQFVFLKWFLKCAPVNITFRFICSLHSSYVLSCNGNNVQHCFSTKPKRANECIMEMQTNVNKNEIFRIYIISVRCCCRCRCERKTNSAIAKVSVSLSVCVEKRNLRFVCAVLFFVVVWKRRGRKKMCKKYL